MSGFSDLFTENEDSNDENEVNVEESEFLLSFLLIVFPPPELSVSTGPFGHVKDSVFLLL